MQSFERLIVVPITEQGSTGMPVGECGEVFW